MKKKGIIIVCMLIVIIIIMVIALNRKDESEITDKQLSEENNIITKEQMREGINKKIKDKLKREGLILEEDRMHKTGSLEIDGTIYNVYLNNKERLENDKIEIYELNHNIILEIGKNAEDGEIIIENEKYWKSGTVIIKLSDNEEINKIIKETI